MFYESVLCLRSLYLFLMVPWAGLLCVIVEFPGRTTCICVSICYKSDPFIDSRLHSHLYHTRFCFAGGKNQGHHDIKIMKKACLHILCNGLVFDTCLVI